MRDEYGTNAYESPLKAPKKGSERHIGDLCCQGNGARKISVQNGKVIAYTVAPRKAKKEIPVST
jgi:hypothetical protein